MALLVMCALPAGCEREARRYEDRPAVPAPAAETPLTPLQPGAAAAEPSSPGPYDENAYGIAEGKRLFTWYNCNGCHAHGGGAIGPALMDAKWIYGSAPAQIYASIAEGRPNGMPAFGGKLPSHQVWQLVAYVRSLSGNVRKDAAPGRSDHLTARKPELRKEREQPRQTGHR